MSDTLVGQFIRVLMSNGSQFSGEVLNAKDDRLTVLSGQDVFDIYRNHIAVVHLNATANNSTRQFRSNEKESFKSKSTPDVDSDSEFPQNYIGSASSNETFYLPSDVLAPEEQIRPTVDAFELTSYFGGNHDSKIDFKLNDEPEGKK